MVPVVGTIISYKLARSPKNMGYFLLRLCKQAEPEREEQCYAFLTSQQYPDFVYNMEEWSVWTGWTVCALVPVSDDFYHRYQGILTSPLTYHLLQGNQVLVPDPEHKLEW